MSTSSDQVWGFTTWRAEAKHRLPAGASLNSAVSARCGQSPPWFDFWKGSGSQLEEEHLVTLPACKRCEKLSGADKSKSEEWKERVRAGARKVSSGT